MRYCDGCAADETERDLPERRAYRGLLLCTECQKWQVKAPVQPREVITRARYRAAWRHRQAQPQLDLVDLIVQCP